MRAQLGCDGTAPTWPWTAHLLTGEPLTECPQRTIRRAPAAVRKELGRAWGEEYPAWREGRWLDDGGMNDQPARWWALMVEIDELEARSQTRFRELRPNAQE